MPEDEKELPPGALELMDYIQVISLDPGLLFTSDSDRLKTWHELQNKRRRAWERPKTCSVRDCAKMSIRRSHTIQRSKPLQAIGEGGHVVAPIWVGDGIEVKPVGVKLASTFAGFCEEHELLFESFEKAGVILTDHEATLQIFRTLCREIVRERHDVESLTQIHDEVMARFDIAVKDKATQLSVQFKTYSTDIGQIGELKEQLKVKIDTLASLERMYDAHLPALDGSVSTGLEGQVIQIDIVLPVALSGQGNIAFSGTDPTVVFGVIPNANGSLVYMVGPPGSQAGIDAFMTDCEHRLRLLDIVESWMIRGTDHWFMTPSTWDKIPPGRQSIHCQELAEFDKGLSKPPSKSIFDDVRRAALAEVQTDGSPEVDAYLNLHRNKLI